MSNEIRPEGIDRTVDWFTFDRLLTILVFLAITLAALLMPAQNDTWWHLKAGQHIWATRRVLLQDTFSFTASGAFWPNHEWLSQVLFFGVHAVGGLPLLTIVCAAAVVGAWSIAWRLTPAPPRVKFLLVAAVLSGATTAWALRPQVISLFLVAVTVALLVRRRYAWLPPLFLLWANLHGAVLTGVLLLAAGLAAALLEPGDRDREGRKEQPNSSRSWRSLRSLTPFTQLALAAALCLLATLATPLGAHLWLEIPAFFVRIRHVPVDEFSAPSLTAPLWIPFWMAAAALVGLAAARAIQYVSTSFRGLWPLRLGTPRRLSRRRLQLLQAKADRPQHSSDFTRVACALALLPPALTGARNVGPFLLIAVPALATLMPESWRQTERKRTEHTWLNAVAAVTATAVVGVAVAYSHVRAVDRLGWSPLSPASIAALESCPGNVYNRFDEGGYLIWFAPSHRVFIDSRFLPYADDFITEHVRIERTGESETAFRRYGIHCAYVPAQSLVGNRLRSAGWKTLYHDSKWAVLADTPRKSRVSSLKAQGSSGG